MTTIRGIGIAAFRLVGVLAFVVVLAACGTVDTPTGGGGGGDDGDAGASDTPYWALNRIDVEQATGATATVGAGDTTVEFSGSTPDGWSVVISSSIPFSGVGGGVQGTSAAMSVTLNRPGASCTITPATDDGNDFALLNIAFVADEPAGILSVTTTCSGFHDAPATGPDPGTSWSLQFVPPSD